MNIVGIVTEHNPFHNGHKYHIDAAKEACDADAVVSVMSGHFLQRGEPSLFNKWCRAEMAILGGVDIVIELPAAFSVRSANMFSYGAAALLNSTGIVTHLCFGSESGDIDSFLPTARLLNSEPKEFRNLLSGFLAEGLSYPAARAKALTAYSPISACSSEFYSSPNNILGIEYIKSLLKLKSSIKPVTIKRIAAGYHDLEINQDKQISSATSIRVEMSNSVGHLSTTIENVVPETSYHIIKNEVAAGRGPVFSENLRQTLFYLLRTVSDEYFNSICDVSEGLEHRILDCSTRAVSVKNLIELVKTKRYTWTRIQRILSYLMLGYSSSFAESFDSTGPRYIRILGLSTKGRRLLKTMKKNADLPVVIRTAPHLAKRDSVAEMLDFDVKATDIYTTLFLNSSMPKQGLDCRIMPYFSKD